MIRINLLPPEITQKRKDEQRWRWVILGSIVAVAAVVAVFLFVQVQVYNKESDVAAITQKAAELRQQSTRFQVFQEKQSTLDARRKIADDALSGRLDWARIFTNIELVTPPEIYLVGLNCNQPESAQSAPPGALAGAEAANGDLSVEGYVIDYKDDSPDLGHKPLAKFLVRLADLDNVASMWVTRSEKPLQLEAQNPNIHFVVVGEVTPDETTTAAVDVPPAPQ